MPKLNWKKSLKQHWYHPIPSPTQKHPTVTICDATHHCNTCGKKLTNKNYHIKSLFNCDKCTRKFAKEFMKLQRKNINESIKQHCKENNLKLLRWDKLTPYQKKKLLKNPNPKTYIWCDFRCGQIIPEGIPKVEQ